MIDMAQQKAVQRIALAVFQRNELDRGRTSSTVAITAPSPGVGVSHVSRMICQELSRDPKRRALRCTTETLARLPLDTAVSIEPLCVRNEQNYWTLLPGNDDPTLWEFDVMARRASLHRLSRLFDYLVVDCPAISAEPQIAGIASLVNSVLLVVGAGTNTSKEVVHAEQVIVSSGGTLSGCILNRRRYPIPAWLYKALRGTH